MVISIVVGLIAVCLQFVLGGAGIENLLCSIISFAVPAGLGILIIQTKVYAKNPIATAAIFSYLIGCFIGPLLVQTLALRPIQYNLVEPLRLFVTNSLLALILVIALFVSVAGPFGRMSDLVQRNVVSKIGLMASPPIISCYLLGIVGILAQLYTASSIYDNRVEYGDVLGKATQGLIFLSYLPLLLLVRPDRQASPREIGGLAIYLLVMLLVAIVRNQRGTFGEVIVFVVLALMYASFSGKHEISARLGKLLRNVALILALVSPLLLDINTAMLISRSERTGASPTEVISSTWSVLFDRKAITTYRAGEMDLIGDGAIYNEIYTPSLLLSRFMPLKVQDNVLSDESINSASLAPEIGIFVRNKLLGILPTPALEIIGVRLDKRDNEWSFGDFVFFHAQGFGVGFYKTGYYAGQLIGMFGYAGILALLPLAVFSMIVFGCFYSGSLRVVAPICYLMPSSVYFMFMTDSVHEILARSSRDLIQYAVIYLLGIWLTSKLAFRQDKLRGALT